MAVTVSVVDNFNRASLGANWSTDPNHDASIAWTIIASTQLGKGSAGNGRMAGWLNTLSVDTTTGTVEIAIDVAAGGQSGFYMDLGFVRQPSASSNTSDGYVCSLVWNASTSTRDIEMYKVTDHVFTELGTATTGLTFVNGDTLVVRMTTAGAFSAHKIASGVESVLRNNVTDTTFSGTGFFPYVGAFDNNITRLDNLAFGIIPQGLRSASPILANTSVYRSFNY